MLLGFLDVEVDAQARTVRHVDQAALDRHAVKALGDVVPEGLEAGRVFEGDQVVRHGGADLDQRGEAENAVGSAVRRHGDAVQVRVLGHPLQLGEAPHVARVRADHVDGPLSASCLKFWRR